MKFVDREGRRTEREDKGMKNPPKSIYEVILLGPKSEPRLYAQATTLLKVSVVADNIVKAIEMVSEKASHFDVDKTKVEGVRAKRLNEVIS